MSMFITFIKLVIILKINFTLITVSFMINIVITSMFFRCRFKQFIFLNPPLYYFYFQIKIDFLKLSIQNYFDFYCYSKFPN